VMFLWFKQHLRNQIRCILDCSENISTIEDKPL